MIKGYVTYEELECIVNAKLKEIGITDKDYPLNPYQLIINEGIELYEVGYDNANIRGFIVYGNNVTGISINKNRSFASKKFIAMHELCHHWFHPHEHRMICLDNYIDSNKGMEWQANNAASIALVPRHLLLKYSFIYCGDIELLAQFFGVSKSCIEYRLDKHSEISSSVKSFLISCRIGGE